MRATRQPTAAVCERCGALAHHAYLVMDAEYEPRSLLAVRPGESICAACGAMTNVDALQVIVNVTSDYPFPCVAVANGLRAADVDRESLRRNAAIATEEWSELFDGAHEWNFLLVDRADWLDLVHAIVEKRFSWERPQEWAALHPSLGYELARALYSFKAQDLLISLAKLVANRATADLIGAVDELSRWLIFPSVIESVRLSLRPMRLLFGPTSVPASLDQLLIDLGEGCDTLTALRRFQDRAVSVGGSPEHGVSLLADESADPFDRALVSTAVLRFLANQNASTETVIDYWAAKTDLEVDLRWRGIRSPLLASRAADSWVAAARANGDPEAVAQALARRAIVQILEIDDTTSEAEVAECQAMLEQSIELIPIDLENRADRERLGNLLNVRGLRIGYQPNPAYRALLEDLTRLIETEPDDRNRSYNVLRRGSFGLNAALLVPPQANLSDVVDDLGHAVRLGQQIGDQQLVVGALLDLARAYVSIAQASRGASRENACLAGLAAIDEFLTIQPRPLLLTQAKSLRAKLLVLSGSYDDASSELEAALAQCPPDRHDLRRDLAMRLGEALMQAERWLRAAAALATACSEPDNAPTLIDYIARGDLHTWRPDRAARWASFAYSMAGNGILAVEFLEASLARDASIVATSGESLGGSPVWAVRVPAAHIMEHASKELPIVYINPHPAGTAALILSGPGVVEVLTSTRVTGATFSQWMGGDFDSPGSRPGVMLVDDLRSLSKSLSHFLPVVGNGLMHDIALALKRLGASRVVLVCGGYARSFPLHAAPYEYGGTTECLADWIDVAYAPSITLLDALRELPRSDRFVGLADPIIADLPPLNGARIEVRAAAKHFAPDNRRDHYGQDASSVVLATDTEDGCVLHIAVHTRGFGADFALQDGDLSVMEVPQHLAGTPRLTFAASCRSASERQDGNIDEARQLGTAMLVAGCPATVVALWPVDDEATTLLVSRFYEGYLRDDLPPEASLRLAANWLRTLTRSDLVRAWEMLSVEVDDPAGQTRGWFSNAARSIRFANDKRMYPYSDPCYWAPFQVFGVEQTTHARRGGQ